MGLDGIISLRALVFFYLLVFHYGCSIEPPYIVTLSKTASLSGTYEYLSLSHVV